MSRDHEVPTDHDVLVVDDAPANVRLLSQMLISHGFRVRVATSGERALDSIEKDPPDLVLLDVRMPGLSGYEVCERLKADSDKRDIPVIFISALDQLSDKMSGFSAGGVDYITKPFQVEEVLVRVRTHLALRDLQARLREANQRMERELALAGSVQASLLPRVLPEPRGWELAVGLRPARQTSGDFYDVRQLPNGRLGLVMADVVDKGAAAALYMALACTLMRTFAVERAGAPEEVLRAVNQRLLADVGASAFVTVFYGELDPTTGQLCYANAGHHPPYLFRSDGRGMAEALPRTGLALGINENAVWNQECVELGTGDALLLYTDGITDSQDSAGRFFGAERLLSCVPMNPDASAEVIRDSVWHRVKGFLDGAAQADDMALMVVRRTKRGPAAIE